MVTQETCQNRDNIARKKYIKAQVLYFLVLCHSKKASFDHFSAENPLLNLNFGLFVQFFVVFL